LGTRPARRAAAGAGALLTLVPPPPRVCPTPRWQGRQQEIEKRLQGRKGGSPSGTREVAGKGAKAAAGKDAANGNGNGARGGKRSALPTPVASVEEEAPAPTAAEAAKSKVKDLLNVFGRR
jgi:hypothetical protein